MALTSVSHVLPYALCSSGAPRQPPVFFQTWHSQARKSLTFSTFHRVRVKSGIRASNSAGNGDSRVENEPSSYVATRTYRKALASLRVTGEALPLQVNAALAADGGRTAAQELAQGKPMLVIETYNPGRSSEGSTVSTKLQAPTLAVVKRAKLQKKENRFSSSAKAFAIAFQAVRLLKVSSFELVFFKPGTVKRIEDYSSADVVGFLEVSDSSALPEIARGVCSYALACVKDQKAHAGRKVKPATTVESPAVRVSTLTSAEVLAHVEAIVKEKTLVGAGVRLRRSPWWDRPAATQAVVKTGVDAQLVDEFVPAHALTFSLPPGSFEAVGLHKTTDDTSCTIHLTHAQMMDLADVLDLYCGDPYTGSGETISISIDVPRRSWVQMAQGVAVGALASALGAGLLLGLLSFRRRQAPIDTTATESIFDMAFSQKLRQVKGDEDLVDEQPEAETVSEQTENDGVEQTEDEEP